MRLRADGIGTVHGRLFLGTAEKIPPSELVDTTGAGDAFIGAILYGNNLKFEHLLFLQINNIGSNLRLSVKCKELLGIRIRIRRHTLIQRKQTLCGI